MFAHSEFHSCKNNKNIIKNASIYPLFMLYFNCILGISTTTTSYNNIKHNLCDLSEYL